MTPGSSTATRQPDARPARGTGAHPSTFGPAGTLTSSQPGSKDQRLSTIKQPGATMNDRGWTRDHGVYLELAVDTPDLFQA